MTKLHLCYSVYNIKKDLIGVPVVTNGLVLIDVGTNYYYVYTKDWQVITII